jgi:hypothetical protein
MKGKFQNEAGESLFQQGKDVFRDEAGNSLIDQARENFQNRNNPEVDVAPGQDEILEGTNDIDVERNSWKTKKQSEGFQFSNGTVYDKDGNEVGNEDALYESEKQSGNGANTDTGSNDNGNSGGGYLKALGGLNDLAGSPIIGSAMNLGSTIAGADKAAKDEAEKYLYGQTRKSNFNYL